MSRDWTAFSKGQRKEPAPDRTAGVPAPPPPPAVDPGPLPEQAPTAEELDLAGADVGEVTALPAGDQTQEATLPARRQEAVSKPSSPRARPRGRAAQPAAATAAPAPTTAPPPATLEEIEGPAHPSPIAVWIPASHLEFLRARADEEGTTKTGVFLDIFEASYEQLKAQGPVAPRRRVLPQRPPRRRGHVEAGTQASLYLTEAEREVVDGLARELRISRSALVSRVVELARANDGAQA